MKEISSTTGLCSVCLQIVPARIFETDNRIIMIKDCSSHGSHEALISSNAGWYHNVKKFSPHIKKPLPIKNATGIGCPLDCGHCASHLQRMYLPVVPITSSCDLNCPVCYTINKNKDAYFMSKDEFAAILDQIHECDPEMQIINFTGGEPLLHPEFCNLVEMCRNAGLHRITVSTNGIKFLEDEDLLPRLTELNARIVFSFNSFRPETYHITAGTDLLEKKIKILGLLEKYRPSTTLLTVSAAGVNDQETGEIVRYMLASDFIVSSEIHTVTLTGQSRGRFDRNARLTTPDVISSIVSDNENIKMHDFLPSPCAHPLCYSVCYLLRLKSGETVPFTTFIPEDSVIRMLSGNLYIEPTFETEEILTDVLNNIWSRENPNGKDKQIFSALDDLMRRMFPPQGLDFEARQKIAEKTTKAIYIHSHMDAENFDTARMKYCCGAVPDGRGHNIPTCAYNNFYRAQDTRFCASVKSSAKEG